MIGARAVGILILASLLTLPLAGQHPAGGGNTPHQQKNGGQKGPGRLGDWLQAHKDLPPDQQEKALENDPMFKPLSPQRQAELKERLRKFNSLPPKQREAAIRRMQYWDRLTPEQRNQVRTANQQIQTLPAPRRIEVHKELRKLVRMSPEQRQLTFDSQDFKNSFSDQEQSILKNLAAINPMAAQNGSPASH
ncbi:MAG TPA: DUF3106 domain-containing protein [Candidatus Angelobacter sp.]